MSLFSSFVISVMASIVAYYLCKWLDGDELMINGLATLNALLHALMTIFAIRIKVPTLQLIYHPRN